MASSSEEVEPIDDVDAWLERNADVLRLRDARGTESWERAKTAELEDVETLDDVGRFRITLPDGDTHDLVAVKNEHDEVVGACDCDGFQYHSHPCAHLSAIAQLDVVRSVLPQDQERANNLAFSIDADVVDLDDRTQTAAERIGESDDRRDGDRQETLLDQQLDSSGWVELRIGGDRMTKIEAKAGETLVLELSERDGQEAGR